MPTQANPAVDDPVATLTERINDALPQTQCTRCGYPACRAYAQAIASNQAAINRCPPGGSLGIARLAEITHQAILPMDPSCGVEGPRTVAWVIESACIGCALCIKACPVDCIVGAPKRMHTVIESQCTGCELCLPVCPVDCIALDVVTPGRSGWQAWSPTQAAEARGRFDARNARRAPLHPHVDAHASRTTERRDHASAHDGGDTATTKTGQNLRSEAKHALIQLALQRARAGRPQHD